MRNWIVTIFVFLAVIQTWKCHGSAIALGNEMTLPDDVEQLRNKRSTIQGQSSLGGRRSRIRLPSVPFTAEYLEKSRMIFHAHQLLFGSLFEYFKGSTNSPAIEDLNSILNKFKYSDAPYSNTALRNFRDRCFQIYHQRNEVSHQSYSTECFDLDKEVLLDVAGYLALKPAVSNRNSLVQSMKNALNYQGGSTTRQLAGLDCNPRPIRSTTSSAGAWTTTPLPDSLTTSTTTTTRSPYSRRG